jgi:hypothetical protein
MSWHREDKSWGPYHGIGSIDVAHIGMHYAKAWKNGSPYMCGETKHNKQGVRCGQEIKPSF